MARIYQLPVVVFVILCVTSWSTLATGGAVLNDYIRDYQPLDYNLDHVHEEHRRVRREVDSPLTLTLTAYNRTFHLVLEPSTSIFSPKHELRYSSEAPHQVDTSFIYDGRLENIPSSYAHLSIIEGSISGHIIIPGDTTYHIEPAGNHFTDSEFHTIIYPETSMVLDPYKHMRQGSCGSHELYEKLKQMSQPVEELPKWKPYRNGFSSPNHNKYSAEANKATRLNRTRRALAEDKSTCFMSLQADKLLYDHIFSKQRDSDNQVKEQKTREAILAMFATHVTALNNIYKDTNFVETNDPSVSFRGVRFLLQRSSIITECTSTSGWAGGYCADNLDVSNFLDLTSQTNHDEFCLVHTFTYRDFAGGTLGLAWVAAPNSPSSGVCGKYGRVQDSSGISSKSLNTGIVTLINFNQEVPSRVSQLTFAHEVGHNFGAQHDSTDVCAPFGTSLPGASDGNYIMYPSSNQGNLPNNAKFSSCSKDYIAKVLNTMAPNGRRVNCFKASDVSFCGNNVVENGEECDCGYGDDCTDLCCHAADDKDNTPCNRTDSSVCSPSEGGCCSQTCTFLPNTQQCQEASECKSEQFCDGNQGACPAAVPKEDKVFCESYSHVCLSGDCIGSVCLKINWTECFKTSAEGASNEEMCYVSCRKDSVSECISSFDTQKVDENPDFKALLQEIATNTVPDPDSPLGVKRPAGSACDDYKGYCDVFSKCRRVDAEGPFKQLTDLIFDPVTLKNIKTWIEDHWWAVLLIAVGVIVFMGVFVKVFSYHTPSRDPKKKNLPQGRSGGRPPAGRQPQPDKRSGVYSVDVPMQDRGRAAPPQGHINYAYQGHHGYQGSGHSSNRGHQQFDRISEPRRY